MRTINPRIIINELKEFDAKLKESCEIILGKSLTDFEFEELCLSIRNGGHGVRTAAEYAYAAYIGSYAQSIMILIYIKIIFN